MSAGAVAGITSVLLVMLLSQPRIFFAMSRDGLLPAAVSKVHPRFGTPHITTMITCVDRGDRGRRYADPVVGEMTSIGTLFAFVVVCAARHAAAHQASGRARAVQGAGRAVPLSGLGALSCFYLMLALPVITWVRFLVWLDIGMLIYWFYGRKQSPLATRPKTRHERAVRTSRTFSRARRSDSSMAWRSPCWRYMTEFGITTETTAKWHEIGGLLQRLA